MAGYFTKLVGHVYTGEYAANETLENGVFVELNAEKVQKATAAKDTIMRVVEITTLWGMPALRLDVVSVGDDEVWFVENEWDINDSIPYDTAKYSVPAGTLVRMKRALPGEQLIMSVEDTLSTTLEVGDTVQPTTGGTVAATA